MLFVRLLLGRTFFVFGGVKHMKKSLSFVFALLFLVLTSFTFVACGNKEKYELHSISGLGISTSAYEYNYVAFNFKDGTYKLENKAKQNGIVTKQTGTFEFISDNAITITNEDIPSQNYFLYYNETLTFSEDRDMFYVRAKISGYSVEMIYKLK